MGFPLLGLDSLIARIAVGPIVTRRMAVPLILLVGVGYGGGFLLGSAFHWPISDSRSDVPTGLNSRQHVLQSLH